MYLKKYFVVRNYLSFLKSHSPRNLIVDRLVKPVSFDNLQMLQNVKTTYLDIHSHDYQEWITQYMPRWHKRFGHIQHKKLIEFYSTYILLNPCSKDVFMDAAGGIDTYLRGLECKRRILQDIKINGDVKHRLGQNVEYIECDARHIDLINDSVDKISCHHSFEHFQADSDILFIEEVQRLLRVNGKCAIVPMFIADRYLEVTDTVCFNRRFDNRSRFIIDPTTTIPGGRSCGSYARIYDMKAFQDRIIDRIDPTKFKVSIVELRMDGNIVPDLTLKCHRGIAKVNYPYRVMMIKRFM